MIPKGQKAGLIDKPVVVRGTLARGTDIRPNIDPHTGRLAPIIGLSLALLILQRVSVSRPTPQNKRARAAVAGRLVAIESHRMQTIAIDRRQSTAIDSNRLRLTCDSTRRHSKAIGSNRRKNNHKTKATQWRQSFSKTPRATSGLMFTS